MNAEPAAFATFRPMLLSLSGWHGFCGEDCGSQIGSPNQGATDSWP
jgi:hypothetical protein